MGNPSKSESLESTNLPDQVIDVLKKTSIGYLSVISKSGEPCSYPVAYYYSRLTVYFVTPVSAAKYKIIKNNPRISFIEGFSKKYPGMLSFYARGKELPDERKLYKYRLIRIKPTKIVY
ncbi:MAG TPA: pyridoxamine 5'-phosphate oxidase family protein [Candidatus Bathyarchaeia archaeon]|nr:pyridoxamine 5'-phosphate oxidase family protein [Candidatus Bathyarchaeia archaeon]